MHANLTCNTQIEFNLHSILLDIYKRICIHCAADDSVLKKEGFYPQCNVCDAKQQWIKRRGKKAQQ